MVLCVFWHPSPTFHIHAPFSQSAFRPIPSILFNHSQSTFPLALQNVFCFPLSFIAYYCNPCLWRSGGGPIPWVKLNFLTASSGNGSYHYKGGQPTFPWESLLERRASPTEMGLTRALQEMTDSGCSSENGENNLNSETEYLTSAFQNNSHTKPMWEDWQRKLQECEKSLSPSSFMSI